jgi:hypothetical protein
VTSKKKFIGCTNWKSNEKGHRYLTIPINVDLELLEKMFDDYSYHSHGIDFQVRFGLYFEIYVLASKKLINV